MMSEQEIVNWYNDNIDKQFPRDEYSEGYKDGLLHALKRVLHG